MQLSHTSVSIAPADYSSWHDVRTELMAEAKSGFKARVEAELAAGMLAPCHHPAITLPHHTITFANQAGGENLDELKAAFQQEERAIEHEARCLRTADAQPLPRTLCLTPPHPTQIDHTVHTFSASVDVSYNFLSH